MNFWTHDRVPQWTDHALDAINLAAERVAPHCNRHGADPYAQITAYLTNMDQLIETTLRVGPPALRQQVVMLGQASATIADPSATLPPEYVRLSHPRYTAESCQIVEHAVWRLARRAHDRVWGDLAQRDGAAEAAAMVAQKTRLRLGILRDNLPQPPNPEDVEALNEATDALDSAMCRAWCKAVVVAARWMSDAVTRGTDLPCDPARLVPSVYNAAHDLEDVIVRHQAAPAYANVLQIAATDDTLHALLCQYNVPGVRPSDTSVCQDGPT